MLMYIVLIVGFIFTLITVFVSLEDKISDLLVSLITFSLLYSIVRINNSLKFVVSLNTIPINVAILIAMISYMIFLFRKNSIWRK